jgi:hypothetical protein
MKNTVIAIPSSYIVIMTLVYALVVATTFFEMNNSYGKGRNFVEVDDKTYTQQEIEKSCKSPCPPIAELCMFMCA